MRHLQVEIRQDIDSYQRTGLTEPVAFIGFNGDWIPMRHVRQMLETMVAMDHAPRDETQTYGFGQHPASTMNGLYLAVPQPRPMNIGPITLDAQPDA